MILKGTITLGRLEDNDVTLKSRGVSRTHARISHVDNKYVIEDIGSTNGTFINDIRLHDPQALQEGDEIRIGKVLITYLEQSKLPKGLPRMRRKAPANVAFHCGVCDAVLKAPRTKIGSKGRCQSCHSKIVIPDPAAAPDYLQLS